MLHNEWTVISLLSDERKKYIDDIPVVCLYSKPLLDAKGLFGYGIERLYGINYFNDVGEGYVSEI